MTKQFLTAIVHKSNRQRGSMGKRKASVTSEARRNRLTTDYATMRQYTGSKRKSDSARTKYVLEFKHDSSGAWLASMLALQPMWNKPRLQSQARGSWSDTFHRGTIGDSVTASGDTDVLLMPAKVMREGKLQQRGIPCLFDECVNVEQGWATYGETHVRKQRRWVAKQEWRDTPLHVRSNERQELARQVNLFKIKRAAQWRELVKGWERSDIV